MSAQACPICDTAVQPSSRYPRHVCPDCVSEATDRAGRRLEFSNIDLNGGYAAQYAGTGEPYDSHDCWIRGIRCRADEARFGGIVIEAVENPGKTGP